MALFRRARALLIDSLLTSVIIKNIDQLKEVLILDYYDWYGHNKNIDLTKMKIKIELPPGINLQDSLEKETGWFLHPVMADILNQDEYHLVGYLSEPL